MKIAPHLGWRHNPHLKGGPEFHLRTDVSICRQCLSRNPPSGIQLQISSSENKANIRVASSGRWCCWQGLCALRPPPRACSHKSALPKSTHARRSEFAWSQHELRLWTHSKKSNEERDPLKRARDNSGQLQKSRVWYLTFREWRQTPHLRWWWE